MNHAALTASLALASASSALAQQAAPMPDRSTTHLVSPQQELLLLNHVWTSHVDLMIPAGAHGAEANAFHADVCGAFGARDVSNDGPVALSYSAHDAIICASDSGSRPTTAAWPVALGQFGELYLPRSALEPESKPESKPAPEPVAGAGALQGATIATSMPFGDIPVNSAHAVPVAVAISDLGVPAIVDMKLTTQAQTACSWHKRVAVAPPGATLWALSFCQAWLLRGATEVTFDVCVNDVCRHERSELQRN